MENTAASTSRPRLAGLKVLVIDDSKTIRRTAETLLAREGCEVFTAVDGFDALSKIADHQPDIVFVDIMMPRLDGYQTCSLIKHNKVFQQHPGDHAVEQGRPVRPGPRPHRGLRALPDQALHARGTAERDRDARPSLMPTERGGTDCGTGTDRGRFADRRARHAAGARAARLHDGVAADGGEAIRKARELHPDLILMDIVMPGVNGFQATRELANDPDDAADSRHHGHVEGAGIRPGLGPAPGRRRLPRRSRWPTDQLVRKAQAAITQLKHGQTSAIEVAARSPLRVAAGARPARPRGGPGPARRRRAAGAEWVGIAFRLGGEAFLLAREETREVMGYPAAVTRVPGAKTWIRGLSNVRGQLLPVIDLRAFLGSGATTVTRATRVLVANHREIPAGLVVDEVMGFRRFYESEFSADLPPTLLRCERYLAGAFKRGAEVWPVFSVRAPAREPAVPAGGGLVSRR